MPGSEFWLTPVSVLRALCLELSSGVATAMHFEEGTRLGPPVSVSLPYLTRLPQLHCPVSVACGCGQDTAVLRQTGQTRAPQSVRGGGCGRRNQAHTALAPRRDSVCWGLGLQSPGHQIISPQSPRSLPPSPEEAVLQPHWPHVWPRMSFWNCQGVSAPRHQVCWWMMLSVTPTSSGALSLPVPVPIPPHRTAAPQEPGRTGSWAHLVSQAQSAAGKVIPEDGWPGDPSARS